jgi:hypothetical protein
MLPETLRFDGSQFCMACGMCCNGVLHAYTSIHPNEADLVRSLGLAVLPRKGALSFKQPCRLYKRQRCSNYPCRPSACKDYRCALLQKYLSEELSLEKAGQIIQRSRELFSSLRDQLPRGYSFNRLRTKLDHKWNSGQSIFGSDELLQANADLLLTLAKLNGHLQRHFIKSKQSKGLSPFVEEQPPH